MGEVCIPSNTSFLGALDPPQTHNEAALVGAACRIVVIEQLLHFG